MRKNREFLLGDSEVDNIYHVVCRVAGGQRLFGEEEKEWIEKLLFKQCKFSGVILLAWFLMDD